MNKACKVSLFPLILACVTSMPVDAVVKANNSNRSYANAYQQVNAMRYQQETAAATTASASDSLPVRVADEDLAKAILNGSAENVTVSDLDACAMIYPSGVFRWEIPESGVRRNQVQQCVAVVELRNATSNEVLATTTVAAGDSFKCNIDSFPESGLSFNVKYGKVELPADVAPTMDDVVAVMNEEQKQNAGLKIAAAAIIGGVAGNMLGQKEAGDTKLFGTGQMQLVDTAIGTAAGAGIMAASSYSGKVAGDTIKSTAVNAASGMILGNMLAGAAGSDSVIKTAKCSIEKTEKDCIPGVLYKKESDLAIENGQGKSEDIKDKFFFINKSNIHDVLQCEQTNNSFENCKKISASQYIDIKCTGGVDCSKLTQNDIRSMGDYNFDGENNTLIAQNGGTYITIVSAYKIDKKVPAYAVFDDPLPIQPLGYKAADWDADGKGAKLGAKSYKLYNRNSDSTVGNEVKDANEYTFEPNSRDAGDGALVDINNQARAKGTLIGTAAGGALGGFAGYQGAQDEVSQRWVAAVREYEDSLSNFACSTGGRYLSKYNDYVEIPEIKKTDK